MFTSQGTSRVIHHVRYTPELIHLYEMSVGKTQEFAVVAKISARITMAEKAEETRTVGVNLKRIFVRLSKELSRDELKEIKYIHDIPDSVGSDSPRPLNVFDCLVQKGVITDFNPTELIETLKALNGP